MARRRFFADWTGEGRAEIRGENAHHLARVLRVQPGQVFEIAGGEGVFLGTVVDVRKELVSFELTESLGGGVALPETVLYLALIKFEAFEWAVEKATELGVTRIVPVEAQRSDSGLLAGAVKRAERWRKIAREASEQSRRSAVPEIGGPVKLAKVLGEAFDSKVWLEERPGAAPLLEVLRPGRLALAIGPEGGWTDGERAMLGEQGWSAATLGSSILRAETAVCAALAVAGAWRMGPGGQEGVRGRDEP